MSNIFLITTKNNNYPEIDDKNKIYLGNWCLQNKYIADKGEKIADYHWDDRDKLEKDFEYILNLSKKLSKSIGDELNKIHKIDKNDKYWALILEYWLITFISSSFDLWENFDLTLKKNKIDTVLVSIGENINFKDLIVENSREFSMLCTNHLWVSYLTKQMTEFFQKNNNLTINLKLKNEITSVNKYTAYIGPRKNKKNFFKNIFITTYVKISKLFNSNNEIITYRTRIGVINEVLLNIRLKQIPFFFNRLFYNKNKTNHELRKNLKLKFLTNNNFEKFLIKYLFLLIPKEFLEDFTNIDKYIDEYFPKKPKIILTSNSLIRENIFTRYIANMKEKGCKCLYMQHGGVYGHLKSHWNEVFENRVSDKYITWGWKNSENNIPFGIVKKLPIKPDEIKKINTDKYIYFLRSRPRYNIKINSSVGSNQLCKYYNECINFFKNENLYKIKKEIVPRFHEAKFDWNHEEIWKKEFPEINFSYTNTESLKQVYSNYELIIYSYIGTGFLESLTLDKPFILIAPLKEWRLRDNVMNDFNQLKIAKIFFETNEEAVSHLNNIQSNIYEWWDKKEVKIIKEEFKEKYARYINEDQKVNNLFKLIKENL